MSEWIVLPCLDKLRSEFNALNPNRDKGADGTIGDTNHSSSSDHTPDENSSALRGRDSDSRNEVHALDIDSTGPWPSGVTFDEMIQYLINECRKTGTSGKDRGRLRYIIWNRYIYEASNGWAKRSYTGSSDPHTNHAHFSAEYDTGHYENDTSPWGIEETFMTTQFTSEDRDFFWAKPLDNPYTAEADTTTAGGYLRYAPSLSGIQNGMLTVLKPLFDAVGADIDEVQALLDTVPTAEENAQATAQAISGMPIENIASVLNSTLTPEQREQLKTLI